MLLCQTCHTYRCFSHGSLTIQSAFSCNHNVSIFHIFFQRSFFQHNLNPRLQNCIGKTQKCKSQASCCTRTCLVGIDLCAFFLCKCGIFFQPFIHLHNHRGGCPFLRPEYCTASFLSTENICYITGNTKFTF